uniref:Uncharacterized protein n=1 Tax=Anopheles maculatus TaxID=74869 RepID=A0A182SPN0_9DIPT
MKSIIDNQGEEAVKLKVRLLQYCEFFVERGVLGVTKEVQHLVLEYKGETVVPAERQDTCANLRIPTVPTTMMGVCRLAQIYYTLVLSPSETDPRTNTSSQLHTTWFTSDWLDRVYWWRGEVACPLPSKPNLSRTRYWCPDADTAHYD